MRLSKKIITPQDFFIDDGEWHNFQNGDIVIYSLEHVLSKTKENGYDAVQNVFSVNANNAVKIITFFEPYDEDSNKPVKYKPRIFIGNVSKQYEITDLLDAEESMIFENYNMLQQKKPKYQRQLLNKLNNDAVRENILRIIRDDNFTNYSKNNNYNARNEIYKFVQKPHPERQYKISPYFNVREDDIKNLEKVNCFGCWYQSFC